MKVKEVNTTTKPKSYQEKILSEKTGIIISVLALSVLLISILIFIYYGSWNISNILDEAKVGHFGNFIGGLVGTLVAFAGIVLYYVALTEQRKDIKINQDALQLQNTALNEQIREFQLQKDELISTRKVYEKQSRTMQNQQFDSNYFSLLNVYIKIKNINNPDPNAEDFFQSFYNELYATVTLTEDEYSITTINKISIDAYTTLYLKYRGKLSTYFKTIYRLMKYIDDCDHLKDDEKELYSKILRAQISDNELLVLYYNYHSIYGSKAQSLILKYKLLKHTQRLSKIEFNKRFTLSDQNKKNILILFVDWIIELLSNNIKKAKEFETEGPIELQEIFNEYEFVVGLIIDVSYNLTITIKNEQVANLPFEIDLFAEFINFLLLDYFFLERYKKIDQDNLKFNKNLTASTITLIYNIENC
jgi:hypothetical protein